MRHLSKGLPVGMAAVLCLALALSGCAGMGMGGGDYTRGQTQQVMVVSMGTVQAVRPVSIQGTKTGAGTLAGGVLGGALGSGIGRGTGRLVGAVGGAIVGGLAGNAVEEAGSKQNGVEITVELDGGKTVAVVQAAEPNVWFNAGDRVRVLTAPDGSARVSK
ncbi:MAG TPA: glycine zipper 2TM domain-containing protein [Candidatus Deferrimicrobiaceae bacterium]|jgi:outer membrane lipoprotein SlyB